MSTTTRVENLYKGGSPDGVLNTDPNGHRPDRSRPRLSHHNSGVRKQKTQKNTQARVCRHWGIRG